MHSLPTPQATSPLATWLYYLENLHASVIELGLERVKRVAQQANLLHPAPIVFTVAGTNGKGTTCRTLEAILMAAGFRVGVYSSPHLIRYTERVRIQGEELPEADHAASFAFVESQRGDVSLTYFEFSTLSALYLFRQAKLDVVILEVGLGGRLDATNIVDPSVAVITSIALDHTDWLGDSRESIGREKAGILRSERPLVVGETEMPLSISDEAEQQGARLYRVGVAWHYQRDGQRWCWGNGEVEWGELPLPAVPLANAATALAALFYSPLVVSQEAIRSGLLAASLPGRFQQVCEQPRVILDVAHNPHAARYLAERLQALPRDNGVVHCVVGMLADKDIEGTLACLQPIVQHWYCAPLTVPRGASAEQLAQHLPHCRQYANIEEAWRNAMQVAAEQDIVVVCGSFFTVAQIMQALESRRECGQ